MKTRLSAMAVAISSISMLTACSGGSSGPGTFTAPPTTTQAAPTVTVTALATATAGYAFNVTWSSTDATSCSSSDLTGVSATSGTVSQTESAAATKTYSVTCTGAGGDATNSATVTVGAAPTAEGAWQGPTSDNRTISGVVLSADASLKSGYWLTYTRPHSVAPAGFIAGTGTSAPDYSDTTASSGTFSSTNLKEFNFAGGAVNGNATLTSPYAKKASLGTVASPGNMSPVSGYDVTSVITPSDSTTFPGKTILFNTSTPFAGTGSFSAGVLTLNVTGSLQMDATALGPGLLANIQTLTQTWKFNTTADGAGTYSLVESTSQSAPLTSTDSYVSTTTCMDAPASLYPVCGLSNGGNPTPPFYPLNSYFPLYDNNDPTNTYYSSQSFDPATDQSFNPTVTPMNIWASALLGGALPYELEFTLTPSGGIPATARTFSSTYSPAYETAPSLAAVAGSYTATPAYTGINSSMYTNTTTFSISSGGAIVGAETTSHCNYSATIAPHATGNAYDVTTLTFTSSGGTCAYASSGTFTGVATYDATAKTLTLTAVDSTRSKGFMVVASQPN